MQFIKQTWALTKKDLLVVLYRRWFSTLIRALILPVVFTIILAEIKNWTASPGKNGVGSPSPVRSLSDAFAAAGSARNKVIIIDRGFKDGDIGQVVTQLSNTITGAGKELHVVPSSNQLTSLCPSSNAGVSSCFGAVDFISSPDHGGPWNYTLYADASLGKGFDVFRDDNDIQIYQFPFQQAIDNAIASTHGGSGLRQQVSNYAFTPSTQAQKEEQDRREYEGLVISIIAFAYFIGLSGLIYHLVGHVCQQRERGFLQLIDSMMPNKRRWECIAARVISTHLAFDIVYLPGWIIMGAVLPGIVFPHTQTGYLVALYILCGLALTSYSLLASSLFKRAQISGSVAIIAALVFALAAQFGVAFAETGAQSGVYALGILFPPAAFVFYMLQVGGYEIQNQGLDISVSSPEFESWNVPASAFLGFFVFQIVLYPILGALIEHYLHGTRQGSRTVHNNALDGNVAVKLTNFSKHFKSLKDKKQTVKAVNNLTLDIHAGSITVLLGANGSGKSTTLNSIAGNETITSGSIDIDGTGGLGICPQKNIMFDLMTVKEHVNFFESLKNPSARPKAERMAEVNRIIAGCDLSVKEKSLAKTLSGGQKRKLQLAMMLAGGSKVCCIDEASSGIDPIARRKVWDILLAERGRRTLLFTTHFLDEAEGLADHVAILSKGDLKAQGSVASLKRQMGGGYQIIFQENVNVQSLPIPTNVTTVTDYNHTVLRMPDAETLSQFVNVLEQRKIQRYRIEGPTIEKVFLSLADEMKGDSDLARELLLVDSDEEDNKTLTEGPKPTRRPLNLVTGKGLSPLKQTAVIVYKRAVILKHDYMPYVAAMFFALVAAGMVTRFFQDLSLQRYAKTGIPCQDPNGASLYTPYVSHQTPSEYSSKRFVWGPSDRLSASALQAAIPNASTDGSAIYYVNLFNTTRYNVTTATIVNTTQQFNDLFQRNQSYYGDGGIYDDATNPFFTFQASGYGGYQSLGNQGLLNNVLLNQSIIRGYTTFKESYTPLAGDTSLVLIFTMLGFGLYPGFFALYPTAERQRGVRAMHYSNGILSSSLWIGHSIFDLFFVLVISVVTIGIWVSQWGGWYAPGYMFVCFFLYGLAGTAFSYVVSLFAPSQLAAFALTSIYQVIVAMLYYFGYAVSAVNAPVTETRNWFNYIHYTVSLVSPAGSLERALMMTLNQYSLVCHGLNKASYPGEIGIYGAPILYLILQFIFLVMFLMFWESGKSLEVFGIRRKRNPKAQQKDLEKVSALRAQHSDAAEDPSRLAESNLGLRVNDISKSFGSNLAVENVTFSILPSEKFALLGPNGAGKSTMISLIRRELLPDHKSDSSSIVIGGDDLHRSPMAAKNHLGVCPQFDAVDSMTLVEHLRFYARARGVPDREANIQELIRRLGLTEHQKKMAKKLSGGTKRKLSLAIALIANPGVLLLDEPSSGMDPAAKRALWGTLSAIAEGRVLLITTHSMEEADALCNRAGIMASRLLALGSIDQLRDRHGNAAFVHLVHRDAPYTSDADAAAMRAWVQSTFPDAVIESRNFGGQMRFSVPKSSQQQQQQQQDGTLGADGLDTGKLFRLIESVKGDLGVVDYSIGPATLDQVFLSVVGKHNVEEENTQKTKVTGKGLFRSIFR